MVRWSDFGTSATQQIPQQSFVTLERVKGTFKGLPLLALGVADHFLQFPHVLLDVTQLDQVLGIRDGVIGLLSIFPELGVGVLVCNILKLGPVGLLQSS